jgi:hypothetical protein
MIIWAASAFPQQTHNGKKVSALAGNDMIMGIIIVIVMPVYNAGRNQPDLCGTPLTNLSMT